MDSKSLAWNARWFAQGFKAKAAAVARIENGWGHGGRCMQDQGRRLPVWLGARLVRNYKGKMALTKAGKVLAQQPAALWAVLTNYFCASSITLLKPGLTIDYGATGLCFSTS